MAVVHNGIIENFRELREELRNEGRTFASETDSEVIAHLVSRTQLTFLLLITVQIKWENRYKKDIGAVCLITIDGADFKINEPTPWSPKCYSHKLEHAGLRYELGICIQTGWIVWINGPYPPGHWPDLAISRDGLNQALDPDELFLADGTYSDGNGWSLTPNGLKDADQYMKAVARARHERINGIMKQFHCLRDCFRHHRTKHGRVFTAVANIVQAKIQLEKCIHQVYYDDNYLY